MWNWQVVNALQLWQCGLQYTAEVVLEGLARAGARGKCTVMGRSAMSLDLQGLQRGLQGIATGKQEMTTNALRVVDAYIKAYYIPWGPELHRWAITHPEYKQVSRVDLILGISARTSPLRGLGEHMHAMLQADTAASMTCDRVGCLCVHIIAFISICVNHSCLPLLLHGLQIPRYYFGLVCGKPECSISLGSWTMPKDFCIGEA